MKKVLIIGLRGEQISRAKREYGGRVKLEFVDSEKTHSPSTIDSAAKCADVVIAMTKFISHAALKAIRHHPGYKPVYGAVTMVLDALREVCGNEQPLGV